jgi:hypothetical protein
MILSKTVIAGTIPLPNSVQVGWFYHGMAGGLDHQMEDQSQ